jgi:hypothetical protein
MKRTVMVFLMTVSTVVSAHAGGNKYICEYATNDSGVATLGKFVATDKSQIDRYLLKMPGRGQVECKESDKKLWSYEIDNGVISYLSPVRQRDARR